MSRYLTGTVAALVAVGALALGGVAWYFGEDSCDYVKGEWVRSDGSWLAGVDAARPGIIMEAHPRVGDVYQQEYYAGHAEDMAEVLSLHASVTVPS